MTRLRELALDARRHADTVNLDANRLATVEERLDAIGRVERRFGSLESALSALERAVQVVAAADDGGHELARCGEQVAASRTQLAATAAELTRCRRAAARRVEREVTAELRRLEMPATRFRVVLTRVTDPEGIDLGDGVAMRCTAQGTDVVELRLSAARDTLPMPLDQGPSGGELSRLALALAAVVAERGAPALVLDEIDSGIGGETAARVGDVLATIGRCRQVLAVTHRAEIAARARGHLVVARSAASGPTSSTVTVAEGAERIAEIARLLSGRRTRAALARATELIAEAEAAPAGSALPTI